MKMDCKSKSQYFATMSMSAGIPYILIEEHLKRCNLNFVLIKRGPNA